MKIVKYVINELGIPILFSTHILHCDIVANIVSAGFAIIDYDAALDQFRVKCYGGSDSLNMSVKKLDYVVIQNYLNALLICTTNLDLVEEFKISDIMERDSVQNEMQIMK